MKKSIVLIIILFVSGFVNAQPWMPQNISGPIKLSDIIANYKQTHSGFDVEKDMDAKHPGKVMEEGEDYLFERWVWYWKQHLDKDGYMVSTKKTADEWRKYQQAHKNKDNRNMSDVTSNWVFQGPDSSGGGYHGVGRINVVRFDPIDSNTIYIGAAGGGPWKTTDGGVNWHPLYTDQISLGVSDICVNPLNGNSIYVCTGDGDGTDDYSIGILKTKDGGMTWDTTNLTWPASQLVTANAMCINKQDTNTLIVGTSIGIYISYDAGNHWTNVLSGNFKQVVYNPADTTVVYAASLSQIFRSRDGGYTWTMVKNFTDVQRIALAVCPAVPYEVVALAASTNSGFEGLYTSLDDGATYSPTFLNDAGCTKNLLGYELGLPTSQCNGQGWYDLCLAINPTNANDIIVGGVNNYYSTDGGLSWTLVTEWYYDETHFTVATVHADKHCLAYNPINNLLYETCDGGIYSSSDISSTHWNEITNGLGITEFYRIALSNSVTWCIGGAQDNGSKMVKSGVSVELTGGDGMGCFVDYADIYNHTWFTSTPNGDIQKTTDGGASYNPLTVAARDTHGGDWITPFIIHPTLDNILMVGYDSLFISTDNGNSWVATPPFNRGYNFNCITASIPASGFIYVCDDNNAIHFSPNFGATWSNIRFPFAMSGATISRIQADPKHDSVLWVTFSGYNDSCKVARYNMGSNTWTKYNGGLPNIPVNCINIDTGSGTVYIGTDVTVFYMDTTMTSWQPYNVNLPAVIINDLQINYTTNLLWAGTYGRSMWNTIKKDIPNGISVVPYANDVIALSPNPNNGNFTIHTENSLLTGNAVKITIMAINGAVVYMENSAFDSNGNVAIKSDKLAPGNYICEVTNDKTTARCKVTVE